jgi:hypothetical protein
MGYNSGVIQYQSHSATVSLHHGFSFEAPAAPQDENCLLRLRMEHTNLRPWWRLANTLVRVRLGPSTKKMLKIYERNRDVYENKRKQDTMPENNSDIYVDMT